jgi:hypothetical protein
MLVTSRHGFQFPMLRAVTLYSSTTSRSALRMAAHFWSAEAELGRNLPAEAALVQVASFI